MSKYNQKNKKILLSGGKLWDGVKDVGYGAADMTLSGVGAGNIVDAQYSTDSGNKFNQKLDQAQPMITQISDMIPIWGQVAKAGRGVGSQFNPGTPEYIQEQKQLQNQGQYKMGGELTEYSGPNHEQGGVNFGQIQTEGGETESNGIVNSKSYAFNKMIAKGLSMAGIDITKHIGRTPAQASKIEDKRYPRENDVYTNNSLKREEEQGRGKFAIENASKLIGSMINPDTQTAKYGGNIKKFGDGGTYLKNGREIKQSDSDWDFVEQNEWNIQSKNNLISEGGGTAFPYSNNNEEYQDSQKYSFDKSRSTGWSNDGGLSKQILTPSNQMYPRYSPANTNPNMTPYPNQGNGMLNPDYNPNSFNLRNNQDIVTPLVPKGYQIPGAPPEPDDEGTTSMRDLWDQGPSKKPESNFDPNSLYNVGNFLGSAYDIGRGLKGGDSVNFDRNNASLVDYDSSKREALRSNNQTYRDMSNTLKNVNSSSMYQNLKFQSAGRKYQADSDIINQFDTKQKNENAGIVNQSRYFNAQVQQKESEARQQEKDIASNTVSTGLYNAGMAFAQMGSDSNMSAEDRKAIEAITSKYKNQKYNTKNNKWSSANLDNTANS